MMDFFADDLFTEMDLVGDQLDFADAPVDVPAAAAVAGPEWYSDLWFSELDPGLPDASTVTDLPLPDPFQSGTGAGVTGMLGSRFARHRSGGRASPDQAVGSAAKLASRAQTLASAVSVADTTASLAQRLAGLRRTARPAD